MDNVISLDLVRRHKDELKEEANKIDPFEKIVATNKERKERHEKERLAKQRDVLRSYNIRPKDQK